MRHPTSRRATRAFPPYRVPTFTSREMRLAMPSWVVDLRTILIVLAVTWVFAMAIDLSVSGTTHAFMWFLVGPFNLTTFLYVLLVRQYRDAGCV